MIRCVDEDSNDKADNAMVSHNKEEEEEKGGGRDAKLAEEMSTTDFRTQDYECLIPCASNVSILDN